MVDLQTLKSQLRIEQVAAHYGTLHKTGQTYKMLCPSHDDHHPSLVIHPGKQFFKCHACGTGGDVFRLVQAFEKCGFSEAVAKLGGQRTKQVESARPRVSPEKNGEFLGLLLPYASGHGELSETYLDFEVGLAPRMLPREWKAFAGRIIFPIRDEQGCLVGFGGRTPERDITGGSIPEEATEMAAKYINSSAASGFRKGDVLYGLFNARQAVRECRQVFVVEGYRDVLAMHAAGYRNTVGLCGTALAEGQIRLLKGLDAEVVLLLDGDKAGRSATTRNKGLLQAAGIEPVVVSLPEGCDPDSLFRQSARKAFRAWMEAALHPAGITEEWLMTLLLMYPDKFLYAKGMYYNFLSLMESLMQTDNVPFVDPIHQQLFKALTDHRRHEEQKAFPLPFELKDIGDETLRLAASELLLRQRQIILDIGQHYRTGESDPDVEIEQFTAFVLFFIHEYYESRIYAQIRALSGSLAHHPGVEGQTSLLAQLEERRDMFSTLSALLERTGAIN